MSVYSVALPLFRCTCLRTALSHSSLPRSNRRAPSVPDFVVDAGLTLVRMIEPSPPPGFLARAAAYEDAATIPRLLVLVAERP